MVFYKLIATQYHQVVNQVKRNRKMKENKEGERAIVLDNKEIFGEF